MAENIRKALGDCGDFVDLKKVFDTVNPQILLAKLNQYGICGASNKSYLSNCNRYVSINRYLVLLL